MPIFLRSPSIPRIRWLLFPSLEYLIIFLVGVLFFFFSVSDSPALPAVMGFFGCLLCFVETFNCPLCPKTTSCCRFWLCLFPARSLCGGWIPSQVVLLGRLFRPSSAGVECKTPPVSGLPDTVPDQLLIFPMKGLLFLAVWVFGGTLKRPYVVMFTTPASLT